MRFLTSNLHLWERTFLPYNVSSTNRPNKLIRDELSEQWFWRYRNIFKVIPETPEKDDRVKIAILDSGIDLNENYIVMNRDRIKYRSFVSGEEGIEDLIGHGTHTAALLLKVAPNSNIFVARITASGNLEDTACIESVR